MLVPHSDLVEGPQPMEGFIFINFSMIHCLKFISLCLQRGFRAFNVA